MIQKRILNGLTLSLMISLIPMPAHAGWFDSISNYFNQPTKNSLMATTAFAGVTFLATFVCAWNWWKTRQSNETLGLQKEALRHKAIHDVRSEQLISAQKQNALQADLKKAQSALIGSKNQHKTFKTTITATLNSERTDAAKVQAATAREITQLQATLKETHNTVAQMTQDRHQLGQHFDVATYEAKKANKELHDNAERIKALEAKLADKQAHVNALEMQNETLKKQNAKLNPLSDSMVDFDATH